jgi:uncharacterized repeat protein (TIGR03803 family)
MIAPSSSLALMAGMIAALLRPKDQEIEMPSVRDASVSFVALLFWAIAMSSALCAVPAHASEKALYAFKGGSDGAAPFGNVISDNAGNLYGTTASGGGGVGCETGGCGTVFKLAANGMESVLYAFKGGGDGANPDAGPIADKSGNLYGTTEFGGVGCNGFGCGMVFAVAPGGTESVLYAFKGGSDGAFPSYGGDLIADKSGNFYATTGGGGSYIGSNCADSGCGTVFELTPSGEETVLYTFQGGSDGWGPQGSLIADSSGNLYGMTPLGGADCQGNGLGCGTVYKVAPDGTETQLHVFQGGSDGYEPYAGLIADTAGNFYGTTAWGGDCPGDSFGCGTVFKLAPDGTEMVLYSFQGGNDGRTPESSLILDKKGNLYGTTYNGGGSGCSGTGCGVVFEVTPKGKETVLETFKAAHGRNPAAGLLLGKNDLLYGATTAGGAGQHNDGVVFRVTAK